MKKKAKAKQSDEVSDQYALRTRPWPVFVVYQGFNDTEGLIGEPSVVVSVDDDGLCSLDQGNQTIHVSSWAVDLLIETLKKAQAEAEARSAAEK